MDYEEETRELLRERGYYAGSDSGWEKWKVGQFTVRIPGERNGGRRGDVWQRARADVSRAIRAVEAEMTSSMSVEPVGPRPKRVVSFRSRTFRREFESLPAETKRAAKKYFKEAFLADRFHGSLERQPLKEAWTRSDVKYWQVWVGIGHRAVFREGLLPGDSTEERETYVWEWIGTKERYDSLYGSGMGPTSRPVPPSAQRPGARRPETKARRKKAKMTRRDLIAEKAERAGRHEMDKADDATTHGGDEMALTTTNGTNGAVSRVEERILPPGPPGAAPVTALARIPESEAACVARREERVAALKKLEQDAAAIRSEVRASSERLQAWASSLEDTILLVDQERQDRDRLELDLQEGYLTLEKERRLHEAAARRVAELEAIAVETERTHKEELAAARRSFGAELEVTARRYQGEIDKARQEVASLKAELENAKRRSDQWRSTFDTQVKASKTQVAEAEERAGAAEERAKAAEERAKAAEERAKADDLPKAVDVQAPAHDADLERLKAELASEKAARTGAERTLAEERARFDAAVRQFGSDKAALEEAVKAAKGESEKSAAPKAAEIRQDGPFAPEWGQGGKCYLLTKFDAAMLPIERCRTQMGVIPDAAVRKVIDAAKAEGRIASGVREDGAAVVLSRILGIEVQPNHDRFALEPGDVALIASYEGPPSKKPPKDMTAGEIASWAAWVRWFGVQVES